MALQVRNMRTPSVRKETEILHVDHDLALGAENDIFFILWRDRTTVEGVAALARTFADYTQTRSREFAMITIIEPKAKMPSPGSREPLAKFLGEAGDKVLISGVAFEGDGFIGASIRGVVVGLTMLARQPYPHRVFKDVVDASRWIEAERARIGKHFPAKDIQAAAASFRELLLGTQ